MVLLCIVVFSLDSTAIHSTTLRPPTLVVTFVGFTDSPAGASQAIFCFTNATSRPGNYDVRALEYQSETGWRRTARTTNVDLGMVLESGVQYNWRVDVPTTNAAWRVRVRCTEHATGIRGLIHRSRMKLLEIRTGTTAYILNGRTYDVISSDHAI